MKTPQTIETFRETRTKIDENGNESTTIVETTKAREKNTEPDYIKLYTRMWCEFNQIPVAHRPLFLELTSRMSYCNAATEKDLQNSQLVYTGKPFGESICQSLGWKTDGKTNNSLMKGLRALCDCGAIKKVNRGVYQINPSYAGRGQWKYSPKYAQGGIENLIATFNFRDNTVETNIIWADDGEDTELNEMYRNGLGVSKNQETILKTRTVTNQEDKENE